jgi:hypothetical protein
MGGSSPFLPRVSGVGRELGGIKGRRPRARLPFRDIGEGCFAAWATTIG